MKITTIEECASTNSYVAQHSGELADMTFLRAVTQTAGRGQRGNFWESEPGRNLSFSLCFKPEGIAPNRQFAISEAVALGVVAYLRHRGVDALVKWPNDIYVGDRKICGILIEHTLMGNEISRTIAGVGINVNQEVFESPAPNPVSLKQLTGQEYELYVEMKLVAEEIAGVLAEVAGGDPEGRIHARFLDSVWRNDGAVHPFREPASGRIFRGVIRGISPSGMLSVEDTEACAAKEYAFKEIEFLLDERKF